MMGYNFFIGVFLFIIMHVLVWFSTNLQLVEKFNSVNTLLLTVALAIPTSLAGYYGTKLIYNSLQDSLWAVRFIGFGVSYLVFPILTWTMLGESMFTLKTLLCIFLSILIVLIQVLL